MLDHGPISHASAFDELTKMCDKGRLHGHQLLYMIGDYVPVLLAAHAKAHGYEAAPSGWWTMNDELETREQFVEQDERFEKGALDAVKRGADDAQGLAVLVALAYGWTHSSSLPHPLQLACLAEIEKSTDKAWEVMVSAALAAHLHVSGNPTTQIVESSAGDVYFAERASGSSRGRFAREEEPPLRLRVDPLGHEIEQTSPGTLTAGNGMTFSLLSPDEVNTQRVFAQHPQLAQDVTGRTGCALDVVGWPRPFFRFEGESVEDSFMIGRLNLDDHAKQQWADQFSRPRNMPVMFTTQAPESGSTVCSDSRLQRAFAGYLCCCCGEAVEQMADPTGWIVDNEEDATKGYGNPGSPLCTRCCYMALKMCPHLAAHEAAGELRIWRIDSREGYRPSPKEYDQGGCMPNFDSPQQVEVSVEDFLAHRLAHHAATTRQSLEGATP